MRTQCAGTYDGTGPDNIAGPGSRQDERSKSARRRVKSPGIGLSSRAGRQQLRPAPSERGRGCCGRSMLTGKDLQCREGARDTTAEAKTPSHSFKVCGNML